MAAWWKRAAMGLAASIVLAGGMATLSAVPASADAGPAAAASASCIYDGREYSDGAVIKVGDVYIQCRNGSWVIIHPTVPGE